MTRKNIVGLSVAVFLVILLTAGASAMITRELATEEAATQASVEPVKAPHYGTRKTTHRNDNDITWNEPQRPAPVQQKPACDDHNVVGIVLGGAAGGLVGHQVGSGKGKDLATIGGALGGAYLGNQYIPTRNVTCR